MPGIRRIAAAALVLAALFVLSLETSRPPSPLPVDAPANQFSAMRAVVTLRRILGDDVPHPVGSAADEAVRGRIVDELTRLGYQPQVQTAFACSLYASCATVNNVLARLEGTEPGDAILLSAHYDSVPAGPGDSDDGTGTATVLEIARALKSYPVPRHSIIFLLDEGEEAGLLGAQAFVDSHPWARDVRADVNVDNRGTFGASMMFETGNANDWALRLYARHALRPSTDSLAYTVYKRLPNDTDFTIFKAAGYQGLNFGYVEGVAHYHTPLDNSANVNAASVQHHGGDALPLVVALANADLSKAASGDAVYFTLFNRWVVHWAARRSAPVALIVLLLLLGQCAWMVCTKRLALRELLWGMIAWLVMMVVTVALAIVMARALRIVGATPVTWVAYPLPLEIAFASLALSLVVAHALMFARRAGFWGLWFGVWVWWSLLAGLISLLMPSLSHTVLVGAAVASVAGLPATLRRSENAVSSGLAVILPLAAAAIIGLMPLLVLYSTLGSPALVVIAAIVAFLLAPLAPLGSDLCGLPGVRGLALPWIPVTVLAASVFAAVVAPVYSARSRERVNIEYWEDADSDKSQWIVQPASGRLPEAIRIAASFRPAPQGVFPWEKKASFVADAPSLDLAAPTFTILESAVEGSLHTYRALLRSERGAPTAAVFFSPGADAEAVRVGGLPQQPQTQRVRSALNNWSAYICPNMPAAGVEIGFSLPVGKTVEVSAVDESYSLPSEGAFLEKSRPLTTTPSQDGDVTFVTRHVQLFP